MQIERERDRLIEMLKERQIERSRHRERRNERERERVNKIVIDMMDRQTQIDKRLFNRKIKPVLQNMK